MRPILLALLIITPAFVHAEKVKLNNREFTIPDGFVLEVAAGPPLTERPICAAFDERGRLYVAESSGSNENVRIQLEKKPHSILRLEDSDGDGTFDKRTVFADGMMFPEGAMWLDGSFYVTAPPQIWKLTDTDDDGVADEREVWFDGKTLNGCANDLHGPYLGPDGWIYWCKGAFEEQTYERPGRKPLITRAAHVFRRRPEGGPVEAVMTGGMDNPVDVAFSRGGERFFTTTFLQHPRDGLRDGIIHAIYGGVYGKDHGVLTGHPRTGELLPPLVHLGAAAPCGLRRLRSTALGDDHFDDSLLACQFNKHKVSRHVLTRKGSTFSTRDEEFLSSPDLDFHPTDVIEDADGSVLIIDTGGWYKLCCPTSQLYKPDIPGAIYRMRRKDAPPIADSRGTDIDWNNLQPNELAGLVIDHRHAVQERAKQSLAKLAQPPFDSIAKRIADGTPQERLDMVWALIRIDHARARAMVRSALGDKGQEVRSAAVHGVSIWRDASALPQLHEFLASGNAGDIRVAAEAIGRIRSRDSVLPLLHATDHKADRLVEHALIYALIEIGDVEATKAGLLSSNPRQLRSTLVALDQMEGGSVDGRLVIDLLDVKSADVPHPFERTSWWLIERHTEWGDMMAAWFAKHLEANDAATRNPEFSRRLAMFAKNEAVQSVMAAALNDGDESTRLAVLDAMAASQVSAIPASWSASIASLFSKSNARLLSSVVATVRDLAAAKPGADITEKLTRLAADSQQSDLLRLQALSTVAIARAKAKQGRLTLSMESVKFVCGSLALINPAGQRGLAVDILVSSQLDAPQLQVLADALPDTGPMELKQLIAVFERTHNDATGRLLVGGLLKSSASTGLDPNQLRARLAKFGKAVSALSEPLLQHILQENEAKLARIEASLSRMANADERRGQKIFHSTKTSCIVCHQMGYLGGNIGPSLRRIGNIRSDRDLLEAILFPSASFVRSYEPVSIVTNKGLVLNGIVRDETPDEIVLALDARKTARIRHEEIDGRHPGKVSIMPAGLDKQLTDQELADLVRFLRVSK
jgi:putative membrane-bound dehydrogenase-like protein